MKSVLFAILACGAVAFAPPTAAPRRWRSSRTTVQMGFMDGLNKAAAAGVPIEICGKKMQAVKGQKLKDLIRASRAPIRFNCEKGDCGSCESMVNGKKMRVCRAAVTGPIT